VNISYIKLITVIGN